MLNPPRLLSAWNIEDFTRQSSFWQVPFLTEKQRMYLASSAQAVEKLAYSDFSAE